MNPIRKAIIGGAAAAATLTGGAIGATLLVSTANAQTSTTTADSSGSSGSSGTTTEAAPDPSKGGHVGANGVTEELLTGDTAEKVKAAALAAVPGGTIERVETDAEGAVYEAHMKDADGSSVTVKLDADFNVTGIETGRGR
jgi:uncharacterized membrane protein YkoI